MYLLIVFVVVSSHGPHVTIFSLLTWKIHPPTGFLLSNYTNRLHFHINLRVYLSPVLSTFSMVLLTDNVHLVVVYYAYIVSGSFLIEARKLWYDSATLPKMDVYRWYMQAF